MSFPEDLSGRPKSRHREDRLSKGLHAEDPGGVGSDPEYLGPHECMGHRLAHSAALSMAKIASRIAGGSVGQAAITLAISGSSGQFLDGNGPSNRHSIP